MQRNMIETILGALVLVVAFIFLYTIYTSSSFKATKGYHVYAKFDRVDGIRKGTDVKISGIKVGSVVESDLDHKSFLARLKINLDKDITLPTDSSAEISSDGLLGRKYLALSPGADDETIPPEGDIQFTQSGVDLMDMIGKFMFSGKKTDESSDDQGSLS
jgi:phospholipid/cholesterol/gamma-HCH transport system substrate-binding protein